MRTTQTDAAVRLYHLDGDAGVAITLRYGTLHEALALAATRPEHEQANLWLQTGDDVVAYLDLVGG